MQRRLPFGVPPKWNCFLCLCSYLLSLSFRFILLTSWLAPFVLQGVDCGLLASDSTSSASFCFFAPLCLALLSPVWNNETASAAAALGSNWLLLFRSTLSSSILPLALLGTSSIAVYLRCFCIALRLLLYSNKKYDHGSMQQHWVL